MRRFTEVLSGMSTLSKTYPQFVTIHLILPTITTTSRLSISNMDYNNHTFARVVTDLRPVVPDDSLAVDDLLSRELLKLSLNDRTAIHEEIHGVRCLAVQETPELIVAALIEFQTELDRIPPKDKRVYEECKMRMLLFPDEEQTCYVLHDDDFRLRFLRCELFDTVKATLRFVNYLDFVHERWGPEIALKRLVQFSDFSKSELKLIRKGYFQVLPFRDRSGRRVVTILGGFSPEIDEVGRSKVIFYIMDVLTRNDIESQRKGIIIITEACMWRSDEGAGKNGGGRSNYSLRFPNPKEDPSQVRKMIASMPSRLVALHNCWPDSPSYILIAKILTVHGSGSMERIRWKFHIGDELEMRYRLKSFGIPIEMLPITESGTIKLNFHQQWIKTRKLLEQQQTNVVAVVECPGSNDVVFRQGTASIENPGNAMCRDLILTYLEEKETEKEEQKLRNNTTTASAATTSAAATTATIQHQDDRHTQQYEVEPVILSTTVIPMAYTSKMTAAYNTNHTEMIDRVLDQIINHKHGNFLEWDKHRSTWIQMTDEVWIKRKVSALLYTCIKHHRRQLNTNTKNNSSNNNNSSSSSSSSSTSGSRRKNTPQQQQQLLSSASSLQTMAIKLEIENDDDDFDDDDDAETAGVGPYIFIEGGTPSSKQQRCCNITTPIGDSPSSSFRKRSKRSRNN